MKEVLQIAADEFWAWYRSSWSVSDLQLTSGNQPAEWIAG
jgi:hypothetical protein